MAFSNYLRGKPAKLLKMYSGQQFIIKVWADPVQDSFLLPYCLVLFLRLRCLGWHVSLVLRILWMIVYKTYGFYWEPSGSRSKSYNYGFQSLKAARKSQVGLLFLCFITLCFWLRGSGEWLVPMIPSPFPKTHTVPSASVSFQELLEKVSF